MSVNKGSWCEPYLYCIIFINEIQYEKQSPNIIILKKSELKDNKTAQRQ